MGELVRVVCVRRDDVDAAHEADRHISVSTSMSAIRCLSAWKEPIWRPNCTRSLL